MQLDVFKRPVEELRGGIYDYGAIILGPTGEGVVRNSYEMAVGFLAVSIMLVWGSGGDSEIVAVS